MEKILAIVFLLLLQDSLAQEKVDRKNPDLYQWSLAVSPDLDQEQNTLIANIRANYMQGGFIYSLEYDHNIYPYSADGPSIPEDRITQINALIGRTINHPWYRLSGHLGLGYFWGYKHLLEDVYDPITGFTDLMYVRKDVHSVGIPICLGARLIPLKYFAVGFDLEANFLNLDFDPTFRLVLEFGKVR